jgi:hypothetical protein
MIQASSQQHATPARRFEVRLGHIRVEVQADTMHEALVRARQKLSNEFPRLWDMIHQAPESRFMVQPVE